MALILGLESSCDDTAAALVTSDRQILAQAVVGQNEAHRPFGGVVPEIAARAHVEILPDLVRGVLVEAGKNIADVDVIAATAGPGLIGGVMVALLAGKGLALGTGKPLVAVNHLEGHALSPRLVDPDLDFPYLLLLVSGGHCQLLEVRAVGDYRRLATTIDDAAGEAFDKAAKLLGLPPDFDHVLILLVFSDSFLQPVSYFGPQPTTGFGNETRFNPKLRSWPGFNENLSLARSINLHGEQKRLDFRWETFNLLNRTQFGPLSNATTIQNPNFGLWRTQANTQRRMQVSLKLYW